MPTEPRQVPVGPQPDAARRRLHIHGIKEMPAGYDAEVAELFRDLRAATALSEMDLAARLGTRPEVVQALEQGALYALPPWAETCRVVNAYGALLNLDVRPLLRRIYAQLEAGIVELQPKPMPDMPVMTPPENRRFRLRARAMPARRARAKSARHSLAAAGSRKRQPPATPPKPWPNAADRPPPRRKRRGRMPAAASAAERRGRSRKAAATSSASLARRRSRSLRRRGPAPSSQQAGDAAARGDRQPAQRPPQRRRGRAPQPQVPAQPQPQPPRAAPARADAARCGLSAPRAPHLTEPEPRSPSAAGRALLKWALGALVVSWWHSACWIALSHAPGTAGLQPAGQRHDRSRRSAQPQGRPAA